MLRAVICLALTGGIVASGSAALATTTDPAGDFLPTYTSPQGGDLDILSIGVRRSATSFTFTSTHAAAVGTTPGGFYVWGIDRGQGTARFGSLASGVLFDAVLILRPDGTGNFNDLLNAANSFDLPLGAVTIDGATLSGSLPIASIPVDTYPLVDYTFNLWSRGSGSGISSIADFAPDNSNVTSFVPEPASWAMLIAGFALTGAAMRRRRVAAA